MQKPKGTYDIYGDKSDEFIYFRKLVTALMDKYNAKYVETPIFESSNLFHRGVGETTDIVSKETYDFQDRGGRNLTLRPEGTAGIVRCFIENKLYAENLPLKAWYMGPMFRYERPQAGRFRQFNQFGLEVFGTESPLMDAEVISIIYNLFKMLGLKGIKVNINTLGDSQSRENYRKALIDYFRPHIDELCDDCKTRYEKNPLRILDCKKDARNEVLLNAPKITDYLNEKSRKHFEKVQDYLDEIGIQYVVNTKIVRGLDYYTHTVFEVEADIEGFGSQNVLGAGGRYNNLVENIGGPKTAGVGFAVGLERLFLALKMENIKIKEKVNPEIYIISMNEDIKAFKLANILRMNGFNVEMDYNRKNLKSNFKKADKLKVKYLIIVGEEEVKNAVLTVKDNETKEEYKIDFKDIIQFLDRRLEDEN